MRPLRQVKGLQFTIQSLRSCVNREQTSKLDPPSPTARPRLTACGGIPLGAVKRRWYMNPPGRLTSCYSTKKLARKSNGRFAYCNRPSLDYRTLGVPPLCFFSRRPLPFPRVPPDCPLLSGSRTGELCRSRSPRRRKTSGRMTFPFTPV